MTRRVDPMTTSATHETPVGLPSKLRDVIALTKPRITMMVIITAAGGMWMAPESVSASVIAVMLLTTAAVVGAANALNCWLERDTDRLMKRTMTRPLPAGRLQPNVALWLGVGLGLASVPTLTFAVNPLTGLLGAIALGSYVLVYTPMKQKSPTALLVGAVPGALPPLMGWTAATGTIDARGLALFGILFFWQIPHFVAIAIYRREEYERAGIQTLPTVRGEAYAKAQGALYAGLLVACSVLPYVFRMTGLVYLVTALVLGAWFFGMALRGLRASAGKAWAKKLFLTSLVYLTVLFAVLMADVA